MPTDKQTQASLDMLGSTSESASSEGSSDLDCVIQVKNLCDVSPLKLVEGYELIDEDLYIVYILFILFSDIECSTDEVIRELHSHYGQKKNILDAYPL